MLTIRKVSPGCVWVQAPPDYCATMAVTVLAHLLGVTDATVYRWARGGSIPKVARLAMESAVLGLILDDAWRESGAHVCVDRDGVARFYLDACKRGFTVAELENWGHVYRHRDALTRELEETRAQLVLALAGRAPRRPPCLASLRKGPAKEARRWQGLRRQPLSRLR